MDEYLYRAYIEKTPVTKVWRRTPKEAEEDLLIFRRGQKGTIIAKPLVEVVKNRKKTGFRGIL